MTARRTIGLLATATVVLIWGASPAWAAPGLTVDPATDLVDEQVVTVSGSGFDRGFPVPIAMCVAGARSGDDCDFDVLRSADPDANGGFVATFPVRRYIDPGGGAIVDCAGAAGRCVLGAGRGLFFDDELATAPLSFDPDVPGVPPLRISADPPDRAVLDRRTGHVTVSVTVTCNQDASAFVEGILEQSSPRGITRSSYVVAEAPCDERGREVLLRLEPTSGRFSAGDADFEAVVTASTSRGDFVLQPLEAVVFVGHSK
jgi:Neocarzinostatin family